MLLIIYRPSRFVVPELAYNKPDPNKIKQELKLPNKKYGVKQILLNHYILAVSIQGSRVLPEPSEIVTHHWALQLYLVSSIFLLYPDQFFNFLGVPRGGVSCTEGPVICS